MRRLAIHNHFKAKDAGRAVSREEEERNRADAYQHNGISRDAQMGERSKPDYNDIVDPDTGEVLGTFALSRVQKELKRLQEQKGKKLELRLHKAQTGKG